MWKFYLRKELGKNYPDNHHIYDYNELIYIMAGLGGGLKARQDLNQIFFYLKAEERTNKQSP